MPLLWTWWQQVPSNLNPVAFPAFSIPVYWYALFFLSGAFLGYYFAKTEYVGKGILSKKHYQDFAFGVFLSALIGGKLGFLFFYWYPFVSQENFLYFWLPRAEGLALPGMSFVGGVVAVGLYIHWFAKKRNKSFFQLSDTLVLFVPIAIFFGRLGNFFHVELKGRITEVPWGVYFPGETALRHPSTLYGAFLEGILLFSILFFLKKQNVPGMMTAWFLILYGILRFLSEFFREPDVQIGYLSIFTVNQAFAGIICIAGIIIFSIQNVKK